MVNSDVHHESNPHLMLHELLFAQCHNKSDHATARAFESARDIINKNCQGGFCPDTDQEYRAASRLLTPVNSEITTGFGLCVDNAVCIAGFSPLVSAHPPPAS